MKTTEEGLSDIYSKGSSLILGSILVTVASFVVQIFTIITGILLANVLLLEKYGTYALVMSVFSFFVSLSSLGITEFIKRDISRYSSTNRFDKLNQTLMSSLFLRFVTGLVLALSCFILSDLIAANIFNEPKLAILIKMISILIFFNSLSITFQNIFYGFNRMSYFSIINLFAVISKLFLISLFIVYSITVLSVLLGSILSMILTVILGFLLLFKILKLKNLNLTPHFNLKQIKNYFLGGVFLFIVEISDNLFFVLDILLLGIFTSTVAVAYYAIAKAVAALLVYTISPVFMPLYPWMSELFAKNKAELLKTVFAYAIRYGAILFFPIIILSMFYSKFIIILIYSIVYVDASKYVAFFVAAYALRILTGPASVLLVNLNKYKIFALITVTSLFFEIISILMLLTLFGPVGVALGVLISNIFYVCFIQYIVSKSNFYIPLSEFLKIVLSALVFFIICLSIYQLNLGFLFSIILIIFGLCIYLVALLLTNSIKKTDLTLFKMILYQISSSILK